MPRLPSAMVKIVMFPIHLESEGVPFVFVTGAKVRG